MAWHAVCQSFAASGQCKTHTADQTKALTEIFGWQQLEHSPYMSDLAPSDYHVFLHLKRFLTSKHFHTDEKVKTMVQEWLSSQAKEFYNTGLHNLISCCDKCLITSGNYVEKFLNIYRI
ncbi:hypothetical protein PR048_010929 [Dryococelus australis]|uniref:Histone-lysine N-methyltransferase SETMAR n=1 Tax=Dryococelus australis TaxID=614101 RepID=A0ABQ9HK72_9NEOP|nr:hypothetical protein PR048_010929 [Dryococelus australis]